MYSEAERRRVNQCRIKHYNKIQEKRIKLKMPVTRRPTPVPPRDRPPLPRKEILPNELPPPKVTAISQEQREAFKNSDLAEEDSSVEDPCRGILAFDERAENLDILEHMIKEQAGADDDDVSTPYPKFNEPFISRDSVDMERNIHVPIDADSEEDFDQEDFDTYGYAGPSLKNF